jgi:zinc protease
MNKLILVLILILSTQSLFASIEKKLDIKIKKLDWNGVEVIFLEDNTFPTYDIAFYFADGALSDGKNKGTTQSMLSLIDSGTRRFNQKEISDNLEFYGTSYGAHVTHEYSSFEISGLSKDIIPTMKQICHLFNDATFPRKEVEKYKVRKRNSLNNLVNSHGALIQRTFRELSLTGSPYSYPVGGKLKDLKKITSKRLQDKKDYFNSTVKKRIYITGPNNVLSIRNIIVEECGWSGEKAKFVRSVTYPKISREKTDIFLITVPKANQAQVMMGRLLNHDEITRPELLSFSSGFLGGGFTSLLMRAVRTNGGLTYSISAFAGGQKDYGRSGVATFTKNESLEKLIETINNTIESVRLNKFPEESLERARGHLKGSYLFGFERSDAFLSQLMMLDHEGKSYQELYEFPQKLQAIKKDEVINSIVNLYSWDKQVLVVLGNKNLKKSLKKFGKVKEVSYKTFL